METQPLPPDLQHTTPDATPQDSPKQIVQNESFQNGSLWCEIAQKIQESGYGIIADSLPESLLQDLLHHVQSLDEGVLRQGGIGRQEDYQINSQVRRDKIHWLTPDHPAPCAYLDWMERLRLALNRSLFLGLFDYESHYAYYPVGGFYRKHWDAFKGSMNRVVSTVLYLNPDWQPGDGGELYLYSDRDETQLLDIITPNYGKLVIFLSEDFPHEVKPVARSRYSIAGWFRVRPLHSVRIKP